MYKPLVSVIIPSFERYDQLKHAISSVLDQSIANNVEIIVVNDCSSDKRYKNLALEYSDYQNVKILETQKNSHVMYGPHSQGMVKNEGLKVACGTWIAFLDDDDRYISPNKLEIQIKYMNKYNVQMCTTNMLQNRFGVIMSYFSNFNYGIGVGEDVYLIERDDILEANLINNSTCILHSDIVKKTGLFNLCQYEDWDYWKRAMEYTKCIYLGINTVFYETNNIKYYT